MGDTYSIELAEEILQEVNKYPHWSLLWKISVNDTGHQWGQVIAYFEEEDVNCTDMQLAVIQAIVHKENYGALFVCFKCNGTYLPDYVCYRIETEPLEVVTVKPRQLATHAPCNMIKTCLGKVVSFLASPIKFRTRQ